jgi:hypothetical protein
MSPPASLQSFSSYLLAARFLLGLFFDPKDIAKATYSSETSVEFQWATPRYIPEDGTLQALTCLQCYHLLSSYYLSFMYC